MSIRFAINGFGRIGRLVLRAILESDRKDVEVVAINDLGDAEMNAYLFKRDSVHGSFKGDVTAGDGVMTIDGHDIKVLANPDPKKLPWGDLGVDVVLECTGRFTSAEQAQAHLDGGARKVLISAPAKNVPITVVYGVNDDQLKAEHKIVSNASCTTNCLAPVAKILHDNLTIERGYMTTVHAYTADQRLQDSLHSDPRRARAAALSMIPTSTGAARAVGLVLPDLAGKLDGSAVRVPTPNVSMVDLKVNTAKATSAEAVNEMMKAAASGPMKGILDIVTDPAVSIDFNHCPASSSFDLASTQVIDGTFVRVMSWYDNEWGFSNRMVDTARKMAQLG
ncbi:glyceraldehyde-3-phosphate dehydrogenase [Iodidimonas gelatinilytica]|uniref:Glyceraldehyde-3-phosphate dehydrogenase n=2 Tax=Iodidimonas gelatinilytica TaxID=1236966 RepID=A0A5A7N392_9PROT|nr:type I glyceraldehyde-3-phosphate dehydrogenase [Iodidimonas gelatinilytica]GER01850.1 glyceraldehyde-3-phosphate dehydrogenase [Iodidimonas gelatinilytica]